MIRKLIVRQKAEQQASLARDWYDEQLDGLGNQFIGELETAILSAHRNPLHYQILHRKMRRVLLRRFPYSLFFVAEETRVVILAVLRQSENPKKWRSL